MDADTRSELIESCASFEKDPLGFILWAFPWGEKDTSLADEPGPEKWQAELCERIRTKLEAGGDRGAVIEEEVSSGHGIGKAQPLSMIVDTPEGPRVWGSIQPGDQLFGSGGPVTVLQRHDRGVRQTYRVTLDDGSSTVCCADHLWTVRGRQQRRNGSGAYVTMSTAGCGQHRSLLQH